VALVGDFNKVRDGMLLAYSLKQVVRSSTRGSAILDEIYTNMTEWYDQPVVLPKINRPDHNAVVMTPVYNRTLELGEDVVTVVRSQDSNGKAMHGGPGIEQR